MNDPDMARELARWSSRGGQWTARLTEVEGGYRIEEFKHGRSCGAAFRPLRDVRDDAAALTWGDQHMVDCFDVQMRRV